MSNKRKLSKRFGLKMSCDFIQIKIGVKSSDVKDLKKKIKFNFCSLSLCQMSYKKVIEKILIKTEF